jgi:putative tryptophan/tyrosine transport system substrate-binding protein
LVSVIVELAPKRLELLHELLPTARVMALLVNPADRALAQTQAREVLSAAHKRGLELHVLNVSSERDFDAVFADVKRLQIGGLVIGSGSVFLRGVNKLADLTFRHAVPAIYLYRTFPAAGVSAAARIRLDRRAYLFRRAGDYVDKILRGAKPCDIPVEQPTKFDLVINLTTAKAIGLTIPESFLQRADELIE